MVNSPVAPNYQLVAAAAADREMPSSTLPGVLQLLSPRPEHCYHAAPETPKLLSPRFPTNKTKA